MKLSKTKLNACRSLEFITICLVVHHGIMQENTIHGGSRGVNWGSGGIKTQDKILAFHLETYYARDIRAHATEMGKKRDHHVISFTCYMLWELVIIR